MQAEADRVRGSADRTCVRDSAPRSCEGLHLSGRPEQHASDNRSLCYFGQAIAVSLVTAEGVERAGQLEWLRARGRDEAQGFFLSRPLGARDLEERYLRTLDAPADEEQPDSLLRPAGRSA